ncbi:MAG: transposase [Deltaproteobacteria bacterium]|nr:transposase [Deltaproteobacteria bacterium]
MLVVSDDFSGLSSVIKVILPETDYQLCLVHMERNIKRNMTKGDTKIFCGEVGIINKVNDSEKTLLRFEELCKRFEKRYPAYMKMSYL